MSLRSSVRVSEVVVLQAGGTDPAGAPLLE